eukprot:g10498.t1
MGIQPLLGLFVAVMWLTILLVIPNSEPWHKNGRAHLRSPGQHDPTKNKLSDTHGAPHVAVYDPPKFESEETYEAELVVPRDFAQRLVGEAYGLLRSMEDRYGVSVAAGSRGGNGGYSADDGMSVTLRLKGARVSVECLRAKLRRSVYSAGLAKMEYRYFGELGESMALSVPEDMLAVFRADGGTRIEQFERHIGAKVQVSEEPDPEDPAARLVTISGAVDARAAKRAGDLGALQEALATAFDSFTPGVWRTVSMRIDPRKVVLFVIGEGGSIINDLVRRSGCRIQFDPVEAGSSYRTRQLVRITGPGDAPSKARQEIWNLVKGGESAMSRQVYGGLAAPTEGHEDLAAAQQRFEESEMAEHDHKVWEFDETESEDLDGA